MRPTVDINQLKDNIVIELKKFSADKEGIETLKQQKDTTRVFKGTELSNEGREVGNNHLRSDLIDSSDKAYQLYQTLHIYNEAIAYAPIGSQEMGILYADRSAILRRMRRFDACISEIDKAVDIIQSPQLKVELYCRQAECYNGLGVPDFDWGCLYEAKSIYKQIQDPPHSKKELSKLIKRVKRVLLGYHNRASSDEDLDEESKTGQREYDSLVELCHAEELNISESIKVECSTEYGRHLVAARDFEPGETILVVKPYRSVMDWTSGYLYCYHCLNYLWTVHPCDHCTWRLFCSEECKTNSWNEYHEFECSVIHQLRVVISLEQYPFITLLISIFSKALKEAGSIDQLRVDLEPLGQYDEIASLDALLTSYKSIYASPIRNLCDDETNNVYRDSAFALIGLAKYTSIFGRNYDFDEIEKLMENDTAIFVGAFLAKISWIISSKCSTFKLYDPGEHVLIAQQRNRLLKGEAAWIRKINISLDPISMLTPQGCIPNIGCCRTYGTQNLAYALQPIKAGTPLIISTTGPSVYDYSKKIDRQPTSWLYYDKECDCQACTEDWYKMLRKPTENQGELWEEMCSILGEWEAHSGTPNYPNEKVLSRVKKLVARTWVEYPMPSAMYVHVVRIMNVILPIFFTPSEIIASSADLHEIDISE